uniref:Nucleotide-binding, alpha-beta plait n=1 Tax=Tanacetum cinerariifolium TaxID=118510 RepID=A0A6L2MI37_TANCI|nr:nucleotide-binding, alpha-beta plait [Tanacetum cinerariifolium]
MNQNNEDCQLSVFEIDANDDETDVVFLEQAYAYHQQLVAEENRLPLTRNLINRGREGAEERLMADYFNDHCRYPFVESDILKDQKMAVFDWNEVYADPARNMQRTWIERCETQRRKNKEMRDRDTHVSLQQNLMEHIWQEVEHEDGDF